MTLRHCFSMKGKLEVIQLGEKRAFRRSGVSLTQLFQVDGDSGFVTDVPVCGSRCCAWASYPELCLLTFDDEVGRGGARNPNCVYIGSPGKLANNWQMAFSVRVWQTEKVRMAA